MHLQYAYIIHAKYQMNILKALGKVDFTKYTLLPAVNLSKIFVLALNSFMHLQYAYIIHAKYQMNILKALGKVDFTKYTLLPFSQYVHWAIIGSVQNAVNLSKKNFWH